MSAGAAGVKFLIATSQTAGLQLEGRGGFSVHRCAVAKLPGRKGPKKLTPFRGHRKGVQAENFYEPEATAGEMPRRRNEQPK